MVKAATGTDPVTSAHASAPSSATIRGGLGRRLGVVPELRRAEGPAPVVEQDHPVLLPGDRDRRDLGRAGRGHRLGQPVPPRLRLLLAARGLRDRVRGAARGDQRAGVGVADLDLGRLGRAVDPHDEGHRATYRARSMWRLTTFSSCSCRPDTGVGSSARSRTSRRRSSSDRSPVLIAAPSSPCHPA